MQDFAVEIVNGEVHSEHAVVIPILLSGDSEPKFLPGSSFSGYKDAIVALGASGAKDELTKIPLAESDQVRILAFVGLGKVFSDNALRFAAGCAIRLLKNRNIGLDFSIKTKQQLIATVEGAYLGSYRFNKYRSKSDSLSRVVRISAGEVSLDETEQKKIISHAKIVANSVALAKDLVNIPGGDLYPQKFAALVKKEFSSSDVSIEIFDEKALQSLSCGGITGVGRGSFFPPSLVKISYIPEKYEKHISLVGKGITFDTGGLSLKSPVSMLGMKYDMSGAASVFAIVKAVSLLNLNVRVTGWLCLAENMLSRNATRPGDVIRTRSGKTVEVMNTDAEGRLVLADGLTMAGEEKPDAIIDIATLTGAAKAALGENYSGLMGNNELLLEDLKAAACTAGEGFVIIPIDDASLHQGLKSDIADIVNVPSATLPGMQFAAAFLKEFESVSESGGPIPWAHLDIAGTASASAESGFNCTGATGAAIRALVAFAKNISEKQTTVF